MDKNILKVVDTEGKEVNYEILFNFNSEQYNKSYIVIAPLERPDGEQVRVSPFSYETNEEGAVNQLNEIETQEEFELVKREFENYLTSLHQHEHSCSCNHDDDDDCCGGHDHDGDSCCQHND